MELIELAYGSSGICSVDFAYGVAGNFAELSVIGKNGAEGQSEEYVVILYELICVF